MNLTGIKSVWTGFWGKVNKMVRSKLNLNRVDLSAVTAGANGQNIPFSSKLKARFSFAIECRSTELLNIWQILAYLELSNWALCLVVVFSWDKTKIFTVLNVDYFLTIIPKESQANA